MEARGERGEREAGSDTRKLHEQIVAARSGVTIAMSRVMRCASCVARQALRVKRHK